MKSKKKVAVYPGTFDPITNGHLDIIKRAHDIFDEIIVAVAFSPEKNPMFSIETRVKMIEESIGDFKDIKVISFDNLLVEFAKKRNIRILIRGLRAVSDFEYELQMGYANSSLWEELETIYLMPSLKNAFISASVVRSIIKYKGNFSHLVPNGVLKYIKDKPCT